MKVRGCVSAHLFTVMYSSLRFFNITDESGSRVSPQVHLKHITLITLHISPCAYTPLAVWGKLSSSFNLQSLHQNTHGYAS